MGGTLAIRDTDCEGQVNPQSRTSPHIESNYSFSTIRAMIHRGHFAFMSLLWALLLLPAACTSVPEVPVHPITVEQIVSLSRQNVPSDEIIRQLQASGTVYPLRASQLSALERDSVTPAVIDFMQLTYLEAIRQDERYMNYLQYQNELQYQQYLHDLRRQNRFLLQNSGYTTAPYGWRARNHKMMTP